MVENITIRQVGSIASNWLNEQKYGVLFSYLVDIGDSVASLASYQVPRTSDWSTTYDYTGS